jgi:LPXTG-site transpeptidase (sortase) family protein
MSALSASRRARLGWLLANVLFALGALFVLAAMAYAAYSVLNTWLMGQSRYLMANDVASISVPAMTWTPSPTPTATPLPTWTPTLAPLPTLTPTPKPAPPPAPVQIRIPTLGVSRSVIRLPRVRDRRTGAWTWNTKSLFRSGRSDLVGHWEGSAYPGQEGNMILVGHNYGYGYNGVFVRLGSLRDGQKVYVVSNAGQTFTYRVETVRRVRWRLKSFGELTQHLAFLSPGGSERLTLVSCAGANFEPFPERVYVVAEPTN